MYATITSLENIPVSVRDDHNNDSDTGITFITAAAFVAGLQEFCSCFPSMKLRMITALEDIDDNSAEMTRFTDYIAETWVESDRQQWNHYDNERPQTITGKGRHSQLNKIC